MTTTVQTSTLVPSIEVIGGDAAPWAVKVDGDVVATCGNAALARQTAERIRRTFKREARIAGIRALADYLEQHPDAPCDHVSASSYADSADELAEAAGRLPGSVLDNSCDSFVSVAVEFGRGVALKALLNRYRLTKPAPVRELPPRLAALPTRSSA